MSRAGIPSGRALAWPALALLLAAAAAAAEPAAAPAEREHARAELIAENLALGPGENWVALRLVPDPGWHVYWINPGDSGQTTEITWKLPAGLSAGEIQWPAPHAFKLGSLTNYGYGEEVLHLVPLRLEPGPAGAGPYHLAAEARWLVCAEACLKGGASLALDLPRAEKPAPDPRVAPAFAAARAALPRSAASIAARFAMSGETLRLEIQGVPAARDAEFFPEANDLVDHSAPQQLTQKDGTYRLEQKLSPYFSTPPAEVRGVLVLHRDSRREAWQIAAPPASFP